jgi:hypothetical protein
MNTTLENAKQHSAAMSAQILSTQAQQIDAMRNEIGPQYYHQAKEQLPLIERAVGETYRPFLAEVSMIEFGRSVPAQMRQWCAEMERLLTIPQSIHQGISSYEQLRPPIWQMDGKSIDPNQRAALIAGTRNLLRSFDGCLTHLDGLKRRIEGYLKEWTDAQQAR